MRRVLVTGGSGFIGTNLIELILNTRPEDEVLNFDIAPPRNPAHSALWRVGDLRSADDVGAAIEEFGPSHVYHLGARTDLGGREVGDYHANTLGVQNVVDAIDATGGNPSVIYASSRLVCRIGYSPRSLNDFCPPNAYGQSKVLGEGIVRTTARHPFLIVRPTSIWGPWFGVPYRDFFDAVAAGVFVKPGRRLIAKSFGFVGNSVHQLEALMPLVPARVGHGLYLADYPPIEVGSFSDGIRAALGKAPVRRVPVPVLRAAALAGDVMEASGRPGAKLTTFRLNNMLTPMVYDLSDLQELVGELPFSERDGIEATVEWLRLAAR